MGWDADVIAGTVTRIRGQVMSLVPGARLIREGSAVAIITGFNSPAFNGLWCETLDAPAADVDALINEIASQGVPFYVEGRPANTAMLSRLASERGMVFAGTSPVMALSGQGQRRTLMPKSVTIRELAPYEAPVHARLASSVFEIPENALRGIVSEQALASGWFRCYVAEADGQPLATAAVTTCDDYISLSNVVVVPRFRRCGIGTAIVERAIADGYAAGARHCCLLSSEEAVGLYRALGFEVVEDWSRWVVTG